MKHLLFKNALYGGTQFLIGIVLTFIGVPIFNKYLGAELYGLFAAITVFGNLNLLASLGINVSLIKHLAEQGKTLKSNMDIATSLLLSIGLATLLALLIFLNIPHILSFLHVNFLYYNDAKALLVLSSIGGLISIIGQVFAAILDAQNKVYVNNSLQSLYNILYWVGIIVVLYMGKGLYAIAWIVLIANAVWFLLLMFFSIRSWQFFSFQFSMDLCKQSFRKQFNYGGKIYLSGILGFLFEPLTKLLLAQLTGLREVGYLDIALRLKAQVWGLFNKILYPITPYIATETNMAIALKLINTVERILTVLAIPIAAITYLVMPDFIQLWLHKSVVDSKHIIDAATFITIAYILFSIPIIPLYSFFAIKSKPIYSVYMQATNAGTNLLLLMILVPWLHFNAVVISISASIFLSYILLQYLRKKNTGSFLYSSNIMVKMILFLLLLVGVGTLASCWIESKYWRIIVNVSAVFFVTGFVFKWYLIKYVGGINYFNQAKMVFKKR